MSGCVEDLYWSTEIQLHRRTGSRNDNLHGQNKDMDFEGRKLKTLNSSIASTQFNDFANYRRAFYFQIRDRISWVQKQVLKLTRFFLRWSVSWEVKVTLSMRQRRISNEKKQLVEGFGCPKLALVWWINVDCYNRCLKPTQTTKQCSWLVGD